MPADLFTDVIQVIETVLSRGVSSGSGGLAEFPGSAHSSLVEFCGLSGLPLAALKRVIGSSAPVALGIQTDFALTHIDGTVRIRVAPATRVKVVAQALAALDRGTLSSTEAGSLSGKFGYVMSLGRAARAVTSAFVRRQYATSAPGLCDVGLPAWVINDDLRGGLEFALELFRGYLPDLVYVGPACLRSGPVTIFSDASESPPVPPSVLCTGRVAFVVIIPGINLVLWAAQDVPASVVQRLHSLRERKTHIFPFEAIAFFGPAFFPEVLPFLRGADVIQFADNMAVNAATKKSYSSSPDVARRISAWYLQCASLGSRTWIHWVCSALNIADGPSRPTPAGCSEDFSLFPLGHRLRRIDFVFPSQFSWRDY